MAFGFLKKKEETVAADTIFKNGAIYTGEAEKLWVEAVAVLEGEIIAVGTADEIAAFEGDDTEIIDLENGFMLPGFIEAYGNPADRAFVDAYNKLSADGDLDDILGEIANLCDELEDDFDTDVIFAMGYDESLFVQEDGTPMPIEKKRALLDERCDSKPVVIISKSGKDIWLNTYATVALRQAATEDKIKGISVPYVISVFNAIDFEEVEAKVKADAEKYAEQGITTLVNSGANGYIEAAYRDVVLALESEGKSRQRFLTSQDLGMFGGYLKDAETADPTAKLVISATAPAKAGENIKTVEDVVRMLTIEAAKLIGRDDELGTIAVGKRADFAIFNKNPLVCHSVSDFKQLDAVMTVLDGNIAYDIEGENDEEMYNLMSDMYF